MEIGHARFVVCFDKPEVIEIAIKSLSLQRYLKILVIFLTHAFYHTHIICFFLFF